MSDADCERRIHEFWEAADLDDREGAIRPMQALVRERDAGRHDEVLRLRIEALVPHLLRYRHSLPNTLGRSPSRTRSGVRGLPRANATQWFVKPLEWPECTLDS